MGRDYYNILKITRNASQADINNSYRKLALKNHPEKSSDENAEDIFTEISEAYDVLSDSKKRIVYDQFREEGLKRGVPGSGEGWTQGYAFHGDPYKVFQEFFGSINPFQELIEDCNVESNKKIDFGGMKGRSAKIQDATVELALELTLEESFNGCIKKVKISRRVMNEDGHTSSIRDKVVVVHVKKGWKPGTRITFPNAGDQGPNNIAADINFTTADKPHATFKRVDYDLIYSADISLLKALTGHVVEIPTLDERTICIPINNIVSPGFSKCVIGEGMPMHEDKEERGNLLIEFNITFPKTLGPGQKQLLKEALRQCKT